MAVSSPLRRLADISDRAIDAAVQTVDERGEELEGLESESARGRDSDGRTPRLSGAQRGAETGNGTGRVTTGQS
jgi:hypothetical protein